MIDRDCVVAILSLKHGVREQLVDSLLHWSETARPTGGFLKAVLENDLREAFGRADPDSRFSLFGICRMLHNEFPSPCWGSPARVAAWQGGYTIDERLELVPCVAVTRAQQEATD